MVGQKSSLFFLTRIQVPRVKDRAPKQNMQTKWWQPDCQSTFLAVKQKTEEFNTILTTKLNDPVLKMASFVTNIQWNLNTRKNKIPTQLLQDFGSVRKGQHNNFFRSKAQEEIGHFGILAVTRLQGSNEHCFFQCLCHPKDSYFADFYSCHLFVWGRGTYDWSHLKTTHSTSFGCARSTKSKFIISDSLQNPAFKCSLLRIKSKVAVIFTQCP